MTIDRTGYIDMLVDVLRNNVHSVEDLVALLGIEMEDILDRFNDRVYERRKLIFADYGPVDEETFNEREEEDDVDREAWGFHMEDPDSE